MSKLELRRGTEVSTKIYELLKEKDLNTEVLVGTFTNCRENGFTYLVNKGTKWTTLCTYAHKSTDNIIINGCEGFVTFNGDLPYTKEENALYLAEFAPDDYEGAAKKLEQLINTNILIL